jgi:hypothetical protein
MDIIEEQGSAATAAVAIRNTLCQCLVWPINSAVEPVSNLPALIHAGMCECRDDLPQEERWRSRHGIQCQPSDARALRKR